MYIPDGSDVPLHWCLAGFTSEQKSMSVDAIRKAFQATEEGFHSLVTNQWHMKPRIAAVGSCCLVGVICIGTLFIANLSDSHAVWGGAKRLLLSSCQQSIMLV